MVPWTDGIRPPRAGRSLDPGRSPQPTNAVGDESEDKVPRIVPAVRTVRMGGSRLWVFRARVRKPVHAARGVGAAGKAPGGRVWQRSRGRDRSAKAAAFGDPCGHACRRVSANPDRTPRDQLAVLRVD